jgi:hypothetical protein
MRSFVNQSSQALANDAQASTRGESMYGNAWSTQGLDESSSGSNQQIQIPTTMTTLGAPDDQLIPKNYSQNARKKTGRGPRNRRSHFFKKSKDVESQKDSDKSGSKESPEAGLPDLQQLDVYKTLNHLQMSGNSSIVRFFCNRLLQVFRMEFWVRICRPSRNYEN